MNFTKHFLTTTVATVAITLAIPLSATAQDYEDQKDGQFGMAEIHSDSEIVLDLSESGNISNPKGLWFFVGGNTGLVSVDTAYNDESDSDGLHFNVKALGAYYFEEVPWLIDTGVGFQVNHLEGSRNNHSSNSFYLEVSPRYQMTRYWSRNWQVGPSSQFIWGQNSEFAGDTPGNSHFVGAAIDYEFPLDNEWPVRIGARIYTDTNISNRNVTMALFDFSMGWPVPKRREQARAPTYNKPLVDNSQEVLTFSHQTLGFSLGHVTPLPKTERFLTNLAAALKDEPGLFASIEVIGHTDSKGSEGTNRILSHSRAQKAIEILSQQGISAQKLTAVGIADASPLVTSSNAKFLGPNRRIEIQFRGVEDRTRLRQLLKKVASKSRL